MISLAALISYLPTVLALGISVFLLVPLLNTHIALSKRRIITLFSVEFIFVAVLTGWFQYLGEGPFWFVLFMISTIIVVTAWHLLRRLDYYLDGILTELMALFMLIVGIYSMEAVWEVSIVYAIPIQFVKILWILLPILLWALFRLFAQNIGTKWSIVLYIVLSAIKWIFFPHWGFLSIVLLFVYSYLAGYVSYWLVTTTRAEKILSNNVSSAQIWFVLVAITGLLVVTF